MSEELEYTLRKFDKYGYGKSAEKIRAILCEDKVPNTFEFTPTVYDHPAGFTYYERHNEYGPVIKGRGREIRLTAFENVFLKLLANNPNNMQDHQGLVSVIWCGQPGYGPENLKVLAYNVRSKIRAASGSEENILVGYRNCGYKLIDPSRILPDQSLNGKP